MTLTRHGHRIKGTTIDDDGVRDSRRVLPCGGPGHCLACTTDEIDAFKRPARGG